MPNFSDQNTKATNAAKPNAENKEKKDVLHTILDAFAPKAGKPKEEAKPAAAPAQQGGIGAAALTAHRRILSAAARCGADALCPHGRDQRDTL